MIYFSQWKTRTATFFRLLTLFIVAFSASNVRADLSPKQARKLITRMAGFELTGGSVRVKTISSPTANMAEVSAEIRAVFKFEKDQQGNWRVFEIRTGQDRWEEINAIASALKRQVATRECNAPDPPLKNAISTDPSAKRARCLIGNLLGVEGPSDAVRIQEVAPFVAPMASQASAVVVAWVRVDARLANDKSRWHVTEVRTGKREWVALEPLVASVNEVKQKKARTELESIAKALERFRSERGFYVVSDKHGVVIDHLNPRYLSRVIRLDPWHQPYKYQGERDHFTLRSLGPDRKENTPDDIIINETSKIAS
jgi:type II secretion system (T2SS) protein G